jgi:carboxyl-terminal processing protease
MYPSSLWKKIALLSVTGAACTLLVTAAAKPDDLFFLIKKNFAIFSEVYAEVNELYVDPVDPQKMMRTGIDAMLETLDPYTVVIDEHQNTEMEIMTRGSYGGVGLEVDHRNGQIIVIAPTEGGAAAKKGIRPGDIVQKVNGIDIENLSPDEVERLMVGEAGSQVTITISRLGFDKPLDFNLIREKVEVKNVSYTGFTGPDSLYAYVSLDRFGQGAAGEVREALSSNVSEKTKGIILDLRNNPGGLLHEAVDLVGLFVAPNTEVARTKGRNEENNHVYRTRAAALFPAIPVVVLQNRGSASASEIVAGALQDLDRAVIAGERSFGKGLVQIVRNLSFNLALKVTTAKYYIPSGRSIQAVDYTHKGRKAARVVPDSLRKKYATKNGRVVYDGAGVEPDFKAPERDRSYVQTALLRESHYIFFINKILSEQKSTVPVLLSDAELYAQFKSFLSQSKRAIEFESESELAYLSEILAKEGFTGEPVAQLKALRQTIEKNRFTVLDNERDLIVRELRIEMAAQKEGQRARIKLQLVHDELVREAVHLLADSERYKNLLAPAK